MPAPTIHAFAEKVAVISDGTSAIGRAVALQLALQGAYVVVGFAGAGENERSALGELQALGTLASAVEADCSTLAGAAELTGEGGRMFGRIDLLVNCVKSGGDSSFEEVSEELFEKTVAASLKSAFFVTQAALPLMKPRPKPKIVNVFAALDTVEAKSDALAAAAHGALAGLTASLARALPARFRVNAVAVSAEKRAGEALDAELFRAATGVPADDVARAVLFLLSSEAVGLNGQILKVE